MCPHHWPKSTVQAEIFCSACMKYTPWKIADGRQQFCLVCATRPKADKPTPRAAAKITSGNLFEKGEQP